MHATTITSITSVRAAAVVLVAALATAGCGHSTPAAPPPDNTTPTAASGSSVPGGPGGAAADVTVPAALAVPAGEHLVAALDVDHGAQVYTCTNGGWTLKEPAAVLRSGSGSVEVLHTAGPQWISTSDGSAVTGVQSASMSVPGGVPELLLKASSHQGAGLLGTVDYIQRLNTHGGQAPAGACTDGDQHASTYTAQYRFYAPANS